MLLEQYKKVDLLIMLSSMVHNQNYAVQKTKLNHAGNFNILYIYGIKKKNNLKTLKGIFFLFLWQNSENLLERVLLRKTSS